MSKAIEQKKVLVEEITEKLKNSVTTVIVDYRGLNVSAITELRKQLREEALGPKPRKYKLCMHLPEDFGCLFPVTFANANKKPHKVSPSLLFRRPFPTPALGS